MTVRQFIGIMAMNKGEVIIIDLDFVNKHDVHFLVWETGDTRYTNEEEIERFGDCEIVFTKTAHDVYTSGYDNEVKKIDTTFTLYIE